MVNKFEKKIPVGRSLIIMVIFLSILLLSPLAPDFFEENDNRIQNLFFILKRSFSRETAAPPYMTSVIIDDSFFKNHLIGSWQRKYMGGLLESIHKYSPRVVGVDTLFKTPFTGDLYQTEDKPVIEATEKAGNIYYPLVLLKNTSTQQNSVNIEKFSWPTGQKSGYENPFDFDDVIVPYPELLSRTKGAGFININTDADGICRKYPLVFVLKDRIIPSFPLSMVCGFLGVLPENIEIQWGRHILLKDAQYFEGLKEDIFIPIDNAGCLNMNYYGPWPEGESVIKAGHLLNESNPKNEADFYTLMEDSIVLVYNSSTYNKDYTTGIFNTVRPSGSILAGVINTILSRDFLYTMPPWGQLLFILLLAFLLFFIFREKQILRFLSWGAGILVIFLITGFLLFIIAGLLIPMFTPLFSFGLTLVCLSVYKLFMDEKQKIILLEEEVKKRTREINSARDDLNISNKQLMKTLQEEQESQKRKSEFFHHLTGAIKTPLTLIKNNLNIYVQNPKHTSEDFKPLKENLDSLYNDIMFFFNEEKWIKENFQFDHKKQAEVSSILTAVISQFKYSARKKQVLIHFSPGESKPVYADPKAIERIVYSLLDLAVEFTPDKGDILVKTIDRDSAVCISIAMDTAEEHSTRQKELLDIYEAAFPSGSSLESPHDSAHNKNLPAGISLVKKILKSLGAALLWNNREGFSVEIALPFTEKSGGAKAEDDNFPHSLPVLEDFHSGKTQTLLLVDPNIKLLAYLADHLKKNFNVYNARSCEEAMEKLKTIPEPDLILSEIELEKKDGFRLLQELSDSAEWRDTPVLFLTARDTEKNRITAYNFTASDFLAKPVSLQELSTRIEACLKRRKTHNDIILRKFKKKISRLLTDEPVTMLYDNMEKLKLTQKEKEVVSLKLKGKNNKDIAVQLNLTEGAIKKRTYNIFQKTGVQNVTELRLLLEKEEF